MNAVPVPFEVEDPELGRLVARAVNANTNARQAQVARASHQAAEEALKARPARNEPCDCGSGVKSKKCCYRV